MRPRSSESEVLLLCARQRMTEANAVRVAELCRGEVFSWEALFRAAAAHQVAALVLANLQKIDAAAERMPPAVTERWQRFRMRNVLAKMKHARAARQIVEFFGDRSVRVMLVKGVAMDAAVYEEPWYIQSDDVDLLIDIPFSELGKAERAALAALLKGMPVEHDFMAHHDVDMNEVLDIDYRRLWADARVVALGKTQMFIMSPEDMLLAACTNLCRKRYQQLKAMVAIRELIRTNGCIDWENLGRNALACGASRIVYTALTITDLLLGCEVPVRALEVLRVGLARRRAIHFLSRLLSARLFQVPHPPREPVLRLITSHLLRSATYHWSQFRREIRAHRNLRRLRAGYLVMPSAK